MAVIKNLAFCSKLIIKNISSSSSPDNLSTGFVPFPFDIIHYFLPLRFKFLSESFIAQDKGKVKGLITLQNEEGNYRKLKITKFFLEENNYTIGEQLINFAVSKLYSMGAASFQVTFEDKLEDMLDLFVNICKFRICAHEYIYKISSEKFSPPTDAGSHFKTFKNFHAKAACELHNSSLNSHQRHSFIKHPSQFMDKLFAPQGRVAVFKYILEDEEKERIYSYFTLSTQDNENYLLEGVLSPAFDGYFMDIVNFAAREASRRSKKWNLYIKKKSCYPNCENLRRQLEFHGFEFYKKSPVLTKDFMRPVKEEGIILQNARIIFNNTATEI